MTFPKKILLKAFAIYLTILLPLCFLSLYSVYSLSSTLNENIQQEQQQNLSEIEKNYTEFYNSYKQLALLSTITYPALSSQNMLSEPSARVEGIGILKTLLTHQTAQAEIEGASKLVALFTEYGDNNIYTGNGLSSMETFTDNILQLTATDSAYFLNQISKTQETVIFLSGITEDYIIFRFPMHESSNSSPSTMNFCFTADILDNLLWPMLNSGPGYIDLFLGEQKVSFYNDDEQGLIRQTENIDFSNGFLSLESVIPNTATTITIHNSTTHLFKEVVLIQRNQLIFIVVGLTLSILIALYLYNMYCKILRNVTENIERRSLSGSGFFGFLEEKVGYIIDENTIWKESAEKKQFHLKQQVVFQMFKGLYTEKDSLNKILEVYELALHEEYFCVIGIATDKQQKFLEYINDNFKDMIFCEIAVNDQKLTFILLELTSYDYTRNARNDFILKLKDTAIQSGAEKQGFFISRVYNDTLFINSGYTDVLYSVEKSGQDCYDKVVFAESSLSKKGAELNVLSRDMEDFMQMIGEKNEKQLIIITSEMINTISTLSVSSEYRNYLKYSILQLLLLNVEKEELKNTNMEKIIENIGNNENFIKSVNKLIAVHCNQNKREFEHIIDYINENYSRFDLSLDEVAEYSGFAKTYLSRLFKNKTGMSYIEYLSSLRLEKAKQLLLKTDMPVAEIVKRVGYIDIPTFRRKFKNAFNCKVSDIKRNSVKDPNEDSKNT